jgi:hypothetical protein
MRSRFYPAGILLYSAALTLVPATVRASDEGLVAKWSFDEAATAVTRDSVSGAEDKVGGFYKYVAGVAGTGMRFDGYTTHVIRTAKQAPKLAEAFSVEAWIAFNTYPWNWAPIVDQEQFQQVGYSFGVDAFGHLGLKVSVQGVWQSVYSAAPLPLKKWAHVAGTFDSKRGLTIYIDGKEAGTLVAQGLMRPAERVDLLIGRAREPALPYPADAIHPFYPFLYSLDCILDEVKIYSRSLSAEELQQEVAAAHAPAGEVLPWAVLPAGAPGAGHFGAYYATLKFEDVWDRPRRIGPESDVVVRFDKSPMRLVFWQGMNYIPHWVTENGKWYSDEHLETWGPGCPDGEDCEPMSDKQSVYSHVRILESSDARVVVHWRYALAEVEHHLGGHTDPLTGWFDWADEYWTVYPDGVAIRKQVVHTSDLGYPFEWQETMVESGPGQRPEDSINLDALTLSNMKGETVTYSWRIRPPMTFARPDGPEGVTGPPDANIQLVNLKSTWKPFQIVSPVNVKWNIYNNEKTYFTFECWNHWPVSQIPSSGRPCVAADRASSTSLSHIYWNVYEKSEGSMSKLLLDGLTTKGAKELVPLAASWLSPAEMKVTGEGFRSEGYDPAQRAFVLTRESSAAKSATVDLTLQASEGSPVVNPAVVIKNWGDGDARVTLDGKPAVAGKDVRLGHISKLEGTDLVVWIETQSTKPVNVRVTEAGIRK